MDGEETRMGEDGVNRMASGIMRLGDHTTVKMSEEVTSKPIYEAGSVDGRYKAAEDMD